MTAEIHRIGEIIKSKEGVLTLLHEVLADVEAGRLEANQAVVIVCLNGTPEDETVQKHEYRSAGARSMEVIALCEAAKHQCLKTMYGED